MQPLPQHAHHGIEPVPVPCEPIDIFRADFCDLVDTLVDDSRDDATLLLVRSEPSVAAPPMPTSECRRPDGFFLGRDGLFDPWLILRLRLVDFLWFPFALPGAASPMSIQLAVLPRRPSASLVDFRMFPLLKSIETRRDLRFTEDGTVDSLLVVGFSLVS